MRIILNGKLYNILKQAVSNGNWEDPRELVYLPYSGGDEDTIFRLFQEFIKIKYPDYKIDKHNEELIFYLINVSVRKADKPGLIVWGPVGTGKTTLLLLWLEFRIKVLAYKEYNTNYFEKRRKETLLSILQFTPTTLISKFIKEEYAFFVNNSGVTTDFMESGQVMFLDDLGISSSIIHFGSQVNITEQLILARYDVFKQNPEFEFYGTTNLTADELKNIIGKRAYSRLLEMAEWSTGLLSGKDRRQDNHRLKQWPKLEGHKLPSNQQEIQII